MRWQQLYRDGGADALLDDGRGRRGHDPPADEAVDRYAALRNDPRKFSIASCWRMVAAEARGHRWRWFKKLASCAAWDRRTRNERALVLNREGEEAYTQRCGAYIEQDTESHAPGECSIQDDTSVNLWVIAPDGQIIRPVLSVCLDWRSRFVGGYCLVREANEHSVLRAYAMHADAWVCRPGTSPTTASRKVLTCGAAIARNAGRAAGLNLATASNRWKASLPWPA